MHVLAENRITRTWHSRMSQKNMNRKISNIPVCRKKTRIEKSVTFPYVAKKRESRIERNRNETVETVQDQMRWGARSHTILLLPDPSCAKCHVCQFSNLGKHHCAGNPYQHKRNPLPANMQDWWNCLKKKPAGRMFPYVAQHTIFFKTRSLKTGSHAGWIQNRFSPQICHVHLTQ